MADGENKRVVKKSKNNNRMNIKVSTNDKTLLSKDNEIDINIDGQTKNKKKGGKINSVVNKTTIEDGDSGETIEERISKLIEKNKKSQKDLDTIKSNINLNSKKEIAKIQSLNKMLSTLEKDQITISDENKNLLTKLKGMEEEVSKRFADKFKVSKVIQRQKKNINKRNINTEIKSKEGQKTNVQKSINYNKKEIEKLNELLEKTKEGNEGKLSEELKELNENINKIKIEIEDLNKIKMEHKLCEKNHHLLKCKLNVLSNDYEFESKKSNMIETEKKERTKIKNVNMTMVYGENIRKKSLENAKNKYSSKMKIVNYKSYNFLLKEVNNNKSLRENISSSYKTLNGKNLQTSGNIDPSDYYSFLKNDISVRIDTKSPKKYLFSDKEKDILKKLLPSDYYNNCNEKYNKLETEITEIEDKFKDHDQIKNDIYLNNIKYDAVNLKIKELGHIKANLNVDVSKNNKKISDLKKNIQFLNDEIKKQNLMISNKDKNNKMLRKRIDILKKNKILQTEE